MGHPRVVVVWAKSNCKSKSNGNSKSKSKSNGKNNCRSFATLRMTLNQGGKWNGPSPWDPGRFC